MHTLDRDRETARFLLGKCVLTRLATSAICLVTISACVGTDPNLSLSSAESQQPIATPVIAVVGNSSGQSDSALFGQNAGTAVVYDGVGVPVRSPKAAPKNSDIAHGTTTQPLAVAEDSKQVVAAENVIEQAATASQPTVEAAEATEQSLTGDPISSEQPTLEVAAVSPNVSEPQKTQNISVKESQQTGLIARLFGGNAAPQTKKSNKTYNRARAGRGSDEGVVRIASAHRTAKRIEPAEPVRSSTTTVLNRTTTRNSQSGDSLPGVKSRAELFGINEAEIKDDVEESRTQLAAVGSFGRLSANGLRVQHEKVQVACLKPGVLRLLKMVERHYGSKPIITSGYRSPKRNRRAGGARNSQHIFCKAVDIQVDGVSKWNLAKYLRTLPGRGGVGTYCRTKSVHIDIGKKRDWHHPCRRSKVKKRKRA